MGILGQKTCFFSSSDMTEVEETDSDFTLREEADHELGDVVQLIGSRTLVLPRPHRCSS